MREEIREKEVEFEQLLNPENYTSVSRRDMKKAMKLAQRRVKLIQELNLRTCFVPAMSDFYGLAIMARRIDVTSENDPDVFKQEALKYAKMFGDNQLHHYNEHFGH